MACRPWALAELTRRRPLVDTGRLVDIRRKLPRDRVVVGKSRPHSNAIYRGLAGGDGDSLLQLIPSAVVFDLTGVVQHGKVRVVHKVQAVVHFLLLSPLLVLFCTNRSHLNLVLG